MNIYSKLSAKARQTAAAQGWNEDTVAGHLLSYVMAMADGRMPAPDSPYAAHDGIEDWFAMMAAEEDA